MNDQHFEPMQSTAPVFSVKRDAVSRELHQVLLKVQGELPVIQKQSQAKKSGNFGGYKYADLPTIWEKIVPVLQSNGFVITHSISPSGVSTIASHEKGELWSFIEFSSENLTPQQLGSQITYFKRYNICAIFNLIIEGEDDDGMAAEKVLRKTPPLMDGMDILKTPGKAF